MKRTSVIALLLAAILMIGIIFPMTASAASGSWSINTKVGSYLTNGEKKIFNKAVNGLAGTAYTPVFTLARQTVSGTNYAFFCKAVTVTPKPVTSWKVLIVNRAPDGKVSLTAVNNFNYKSIKTRNNAYTQSSAPGSWTYNNKAVKSKGIPSAASKAFKKAIREYDGVSLTALALLGKQIVAGTNYKFLCRGEMSDMNATTCLYEVVVYQNVSGDCEITSCKVINLPKYLQH